MAIAGYISLPGRRYQVAATGQTISRRQYDKIARASAPVPRTIAVRGAMTNYNRLILARQEYVLRTTGVIKTRQEIRTSPEMKAIVKAVKSKDNSKTGKKAQALVDLGLRLPNMDYDVGETPDS